MKRFLVIIAIILPQILFSQADPLGIFKYATVYTSGFASTPAPARTQYYINQMGEIKDITVDTTIILATLSTIFLGEYIAPTR